MRQIIKLIFVLSLVIMTSCSTQQRVVYRNCDCDTTTFGFGWNNNPYWGLNNRFYGWNDPYWGWNNWNWHPYQVIPRYYVYPNRIQPSEPSRYERRQSIGARPSRNFQNESNRTDNLYPGRTEPNRYQNESPSRWESPSRVQQRTNTPVTTQPSRVESPMRVQQRTNPNVTTQPSRVESPSRVQQRTNTPVTTQPTRSRVQNREN